MLKKRVDGMFKKYFNSGVPLLLVVMFNISLPAQEMAPQDFAYGIDITPSDNNAWQSIVLPDTYYQYSARQGGGDLRVFNSDGQIIPNKIEQATTREYQQRETVLVFFPVYGKSQNDLDDLSLQVKRSADGSLISVESLNHKKVTESTVVAYVIDASEAHKINRQGQLERLIFDWSVPEYGFINDLRIDVSNDLNQWTTHADQQSLSRLDFDGRSLEKRFIPLDKPITAKYIRLSWPARQSTLELDRVMGGYRWSEHTQDIALQTIQVEVVPISQVEDEPTRDGYFIDTGGQFPLVQLSFMGNAAGQNNYYTGELYSRPGNDRFWSPRGSFEQFNLQTGQGELSSEPLALNGVRDRYWLVQFDYPRQIPESALPTVQLDWRPERLQFIAHGQAPFTLAFGNATVAASSTAGLLSNPPNDIGMSSDAQLSELYSLGDPSLAEVRESVSWSRILLWVVLVGGVLLMLWMAIRLFRQMDQP